MKKYLLLVACFLTSCVSNNISNDFVYSDKMSFDEFKKKLDVYAKNNPYPNIDK